MSAQLQNPIYSYSSPQLSGRDLACDADDIAADLEYLANNLAQDLKDLEEVQADPERTPDEKLGLGDEIRQAKARLAQVEKDLERAQDAASEAWLEADRLRFFGI